MVDKEADAVMTATEVSEFLKLGDSTVQIDSANLHGDSQWPTVKSKVTERNLHYYPVIIID